MSYADLRKRKSDNFNKLAEKLKNSASGKSTFVNKESLENGYWQPSEDKTKAGYATIRWMPGPACDDGPKPEDKGTALPYVLLYTHNFKGPGGWYIENCLTTLSTPENPVADPAVEYGNKLWGPGKKAKTQAAADRVSGTPGNPGTKRKTNFYANIYIVDDPAVPENNGKVYKFKFGPKIMEFLNEAMNPSTADQVAWDPFDLVEGGDFKLRFRQVEGYRNYGKSEWVTRGKPLFDGPDADEKTDALYNSLPSLLELISPDKFKDYNVLKKRLDKVLGEETSDRSSEPMANKEVYKEETVEDQEVDSGVAPWEEQVKAAVTNTKVKPVAEPAVEDNEPNNLEFFESLRDK